MSRKLTPCLVICGSNALEQGSTVAHYMLGPQTMHDKVPWTWSDHLKLIIIGVGYGCDTTIVRGSPATRICSICYLPNGELVALDRLSQAPITRLRERSNASSWTQVTLGTLVRGVIDRV